MQQHYEIFVKTLKGEVYSLTCNFDDTVENLKEKVEELKKIPVDEQRMIFAGKSLEHHRTVSEYSITEGSTIHLVLPLRCYCWNINISKKEVSQKDSVQIKEGWKEEYEKEVLCVLQGNEEDPSNRRGYNRRVFSEIRDCYMRRHENMVSLKCVSPQNLLEWDLVLFGPKESIYEGGYFQFRIVFTTEHPFRPFQIVFMTRMFHPWFAGIGKIGSKCSTHSSSKKECGIIPKYEWSPMIRLEDIIHLMVENMQKVFELYKTKNPKPLFPKGRPLDLLKEGKFDEFVRTAKMWTFWFASGFNVVVDNMDEKERVEFCMKKEESFHIVLLQQSEKIKKIGLPKIFLFL